MANQQEEPEVINTEIQEAPVAPEQNATIAVDSLANRLIALKKKTDNQLQEMKIMKDSIKPAAMNSPIKTTKGVVSFVSESSNKTLDRNKIKQVLIDKLRISPERADQIIDAGSMENVITSYIKVTPA